MAQIRIFVRRRAAVLLLGCTAVFVLLGFRLAYIQLITGGRLSRDALEMREHSIAVDPRRGTIFDRNGRKLALSVQSDAVLCNPAEVRDPEGTAAKLAPILKMEPGRIAAILKKRTSQAWVKRRITGDEARKVLALRLDGIHVTIRTQRTYPKGVLAAHLIGITGIDNQGLEGIEKQYEEYLRGVPGQDSAEYDTGGRRIPGSEKRYVPPEDGANLILTIDERLQLIAERELDRAMAETGSRRGLVLAMDPKTGEILAYALRPTFDPNDYNAYPAVNRRNFALTDQYEPGSTFKVITSSASLEEGTVTRESTFFDPGFIRVEDRNLKCWKAGGHGSQTFVEAIENSCNPVFASLALKLGVDRFYRYIEAFGFGRPTGVGFPGEATGKLMNRKNVGPVELANIGFGQGISVTPIQLLSAVATIANGGRMMRPSIVREIQKPDGTVVHPFETKVVRQVISARTAATMAELMESVVVNGSGSRAHVDGYRIAGKTGTAQKPKGGRYGDERVASFIGYGPVDDPKLAMLVWLDEPQTPIKYGGVLAAPVFGAVMAQSLRYLGIPPKVAPEAEPESSSETIVPNVMNLPLGEAQSILAQKGLSWRLINPGGIPFDQFPRPGVRVKRGTRVLLYFDTQEPLGDDTYVIVPDLKGLTVREAAERLKQLDLFLAPSGSGVAAGQHPAPGTKLPRGARIVVEFRPPQSP